MNRTIAAFFLLLLNASVMGAESERTVRLKIIETSDVHGYFFPYDFVERKSLSGTLSRVNTYVEQQRKEMGDNVVLIDNGDILQGQPTCYWSNFVKTCDENIAASVVNYMKYDAETMGNHDVEPGHNVFDKWIREVRCPLLGANIIDKKTQQPYVTPYAVLERSGVKIAILGMITPTISCWLNEAVYEGLEFQEMVSCARHWVKIIQEREQPDIICGLFHSGKDGAITMPNGVQENASDRVAREVPGFDVIFFGHDHRVHNYKTTNVAGKEVLCVDPSCFAQNIAEANIEISFKDNIITDKKIEGVIVSVRDIAVDEDMVSYFQPQIDEIKNYVEEKIGTFETGASTRDSYFGNSAFTDFIQNLQLKITGADISFNAPLSFDVSINPGPITVAEMFKLYRFENKLCVLSMSGKEIRKHLEMSYDLWVNTMKTPDDHLLLLNVDAKNDQQRMGFLNYTFNFDSATGIDYEVDVTKPDGEKVRILRLSDGKPFEENKYYKVAMNSYRASGGGELLTKGAGIPKDSINRRIIYESELDLRHYLMEEIKRQKVVTPTPNHNWKFVPESWTKPAAKRDRQLLFPNN
jgi:2',3'-cyclic-nucleotide 2'-phosphodiesterase/3'-nucleotidase